MKVLFLSWRDTTHPDGGGSEVYVEQVAAGLAARGHDVTVLCAAHPGAADVSVRDGFRIVRRGGRLTVYLHGLAYLLSRAGRRTDVVVDVINGLPFAAPLRASARAWWRWSTTCTGSSGGSSTPGWAAGSAGSWSRGSCRGSTAGVPFVTVSEASRRDLLALGLADVTVVRNGTPALAAPRLSRSATPRLCVLSRLVPHKRIEQALALVDALRERHPGLVLDLVGDGWWADRARRRDRPPRARGRRWCGTGASTSRRRPTCSPRRG